MGQNPHRGGERAAKLQAKEDWWSSSVLHRLWKETYHVQTVSRSPTTMLIPRTMLETWAEGIAALIFNRFSSIIMSPDTPVRSPDSSYTDHHLLKDIGLVGPKGPI
ncbi:hypothetical protein [Methanospirillum lacunae]|uniref:Uncharacterized protein n=2 Tax=Methanospirillum lacunae TaxID=668570 RepID=A0A2V2N5S4_9EURY|nr:hypothetical protein [Methanospirillum lacunae]PWR70633.1 hypothetical protein DK846_14685 [Methanospirillum lacunae]